MRVGRASAFAALWTAVRGRRRPAAPAMSAQLAALPRLVSATLTGRYPGLERRRLLLMALAAVYVLSPVDLLPEGLLLVFGIADDAVVLAWLAGAVLSETEAFLAWEAGVTADVRDRSGRAVPGEVI